MDLVDKGLVTNQLVLTVGYDIENLVFTQGTAAYTGAVTTDRYGRKIPKHAVGTRTSPIPLRQTTCWKPSLLSMTESWIGLC